ncbi:MAG TPA: hypothetical protein VMW24_09310, partial [Sedimentisphaerales bacterium]|nr:hypothetical protein [Sedimentisphaerales bacterium]
MKEITMHLWTWQKKRFNIGDESTPVGSFGHSEYLNNAYIPKSERDHFKLQYGKLFKRLGTPQFHWYYTEENEATGGEDESSIFGCELWEVAAPDEKVFKRVCNKAWYYLLYPSKRTQVAEHERSHHAFWAKMKSESELWDRLFLDETVEGCTSVLLRHPLEGSWIVRNPIKEGKWWETKKQN